MSIKPVHIHKSKLYHNANIILLLIPALIFFLVITIYLTTIQVPAHRQASAVSNTQEVLGDDKVDTFIDNLLE
jgi:hypothetical protein